MRSYVTLCGVLMFLAVNTSVAAGKDLITWADLESGLAGTFAIPLAQQGDYRFGYSSGVHAQLANGNLLVVGHPYYDRQAEVQIPSTLDGREGTRVGPWIDITKGLLPAGWNTGDEPCYVGGMLDIGGRIHFTKYQGYNGAGTNWQTQGYYDGDTNGNGTASGMWTVDNLYAHHSRVGGYMSYPSQAILQDGYVYLAGLEGTSGGALGRWGPNLFAINPTPSGSTVGGATLICHDSEAHKAPDVTPSNATSPWWVSNGAANAAWWIANKVTDMEWIETDTQHGVVAFVYRGLGQTWYGESNAGPGGATDPYGGGYGYHAEGWSLEAWIYDPDELMQVYDGQRDPWSLAPAEAVLLTERLPDVDYETYYSFFTGRAKTGLTMSLRDNRLIVLEEAGYRANLYEDTPKGYVIGIIPEPSSLALLAPAAMGLLWWSRGRGAGRAAQRPGA